jgi:hypothetical protein
MRQIVLRLCNLSLVGPDPPEDLGALQSASEQPRVRPCVYWSRTAAAQPATKLVRLLPKTELLNGIFYTLAEAKRRRNLAAALQHRPPTLGPPLQTASARGRTVAGCATPTSSAGHSNRRVSADHELTSQSDHCMRAGQSLDRCRIVAFGESKLFENE